MKVDGYCILLALFVLFLIYYDNVNNIENFELEPAPVDFKPSDKKGNPVITETTKEGDLASPDVVIGQKPTKIERKAAPSVSAHLEMLQGYPVDPLNTKDFMLLPTGTMPGIKVVDSATPQANPRIGGPSNIGKDFESDTAPGLAPGGPAPGGAVQEKGEVNIVIIYAPWCGWSKKSLPDFNKMEQYLNLDPSNKTNGYKISIKVYNSEKPEGKKMAKEYGVKGFPSVFVEVDGKRQEGPRDFDAMVKLVNNVTGSSLKF